MSAPACPRRIDPTALRAMRLDLRGRSGRWYAYLADAGHLMFVNVSFGCRPAPVLNMTDEEQVLICPHRLIGIVDFERGVVAPLPGGAE